MLLLFIQYVRTSWISTRGWNEQYLRLIVQLGGTHDLCPIIWEDLVVLAMSTLLQGTLARHLVLPNDGRRTLLRTYERGTSSSTRCNTMGGVVPCNVDGMRIDRLLQIHGSIYT
jgi:hypothetical protein